MTASELALGRFLRAPEGHDAAPAAPADGAVTDPAPVDGAVEASTDGGSILGDAVSPGSGEAEAGEGGAAVEGEAPSGDAADPEAAPADAPYEGLVAPEGFAALDTEALAAATPILRGLGVETPERAQEVVNQFAPVIGGIVERAVSASAEAGRAEQARIAQGWADEIRNDPTLGGANYERSVAASAEVLDTFFDQDFRDFLNVTKLGSNPAMMRGILNIHSQIQQGTIHLGGTAPRELSTSQKLYGTAFDGPQPGG